MDVLLDTNVLIWLIQGSERLSSTARETILNLENQLYFSAASYWEMSIKLGLGKLQLSKNWQADFVQQSKRNQIVWLNIAMTHCEKVIELPFHHRDPFDRMLIAQAVVNDMALLTPDSHIAKYDLSVLW